jgi:hypothetical protein
MPAGIRTTSQFSRSALRDGGRLPSASRSAGYATEALTYIRAVEAADGQRLEQPVRDAINAFVVGCKADGTWSAIKASCILAGARSLTGALVPLVGSAPTNVNFVSGDYSRTLGLIGNGTTKYLNSNRAGNSDPQNSRHLSVFVVSPLTVATTAVLIGDDGTGTSGTSLIYNDSTGSDEMRFGLSSNASISPTGAGANSGMRTGFVGASRAASGSFTGRVNSTSATYTQTSQTPNSTNVLVFARTASVPARWAAARLGFYSIGESLDLALLETRVAALLGSIRGALT